MSATTTSYGDRPMNHIRCSACGWTSRSFPPEPEAARRCGATAEWRLHRMREHSIRGIVECDAHWPDPEAAP